MIKIGHLNIERNKHLERFIPFFNKHSLDVLMLQEVMKEDILEIKERLNFKHAIYQEMYFHKIDSSKNEGLLILTNLDYLHAESSLLGKQTKGIHHPEYFSEIDFYLLKIQLEYFGKKYYLGTTHFPVTEEGMTNPFQDTVCNRFLEEVSKYENILITGDFNAPRGRKVFSKISEIMKDNIPEDVTTTIDQNLHRKKGIQFVVDGVFTKGNIEVENIALHDYLSDHMGITCEIANL